MVRLPVLSVLSRRIFALNLVCEQHLSDCVHRDLFVLNSCAECERERKQNRMCDGPVTETGCQHDWVNDVLDCTSSDLYKIIPLFLSLSPSHFLFLSLSGEQARKFFLQSGLPAPVLAEIW